MSPSTTTTTTKKKTTIKVERRRKRNLNAYFEDFEEYLHFACYLNFRLTSAVWHFAILLFSQRASHSLRKHKRQKALFSSVFRMFYFLLILFGKKDLLLTAYPGRLVLLWLPYNISIWWNVNFFEFLKW